MSEIEKRGSDSNLLYCASCGCDSFLRSNSSLVFVLSVDLRDKPAIKCCDSLWGGGGS